MGCISRLLASGDKRVNEGGGSFVEGGGVYKDYEYLVVLNPHGHRCGYVAISKDHPLYEKEGSNVIDLEIHGGCTFFEPQMTEYKCSDKWIGFDCGHSGDARDINTLQKYDADMADRYHSYDESLFSYRPQIIRTKEYVEEQCKGIINQLCGY